MNTYFTADLHHRHKRITELTERNKVTTAEDHDQWLIDVINSRVTKQDKLYLLGDISFSGKYEDVAAFYRKINGQKFVLKGNHDRREVLDSLKTSGIVQNWWDYKEITEKGVTTDQDIHINMMHFPIAAWHKQHYGSWMLHGHSHGSYQGKGKILDVGIDSSYNIFGKYQVFSLDEIKKIMQSKPVHVAENHRSDRTKE